jgi:serine/threonine-protein kinase
VRAVESIRPPLLTNAEEIRLPEPGEQILGKYLLVRLVGEGGMGAVFEAHHLVMQQRVAIKILLPARSTARDATRFSREARAASQLRSPHVARVLDVDYLPSGLPFIVMEFLDGCDIEDELRMRGHLGITESVDYVIQACEAVAEAHARGIVHRDLKPSNLFLCADAEERIVKVLDFGISKMEDESNVTITCTALGTPLYMSPEQIRNAKEVDHRSDIWSLGVILFELLTGRPPFEGGATAVSVAIAVDPPPWIRTLRPEVPPGLEQVIMRALEKHPSKRFSTVSELAHALQPFASDPENPGSVRLDSLPREFPPISSAMRSARNATTLDSPGKVASSWSSNTESRERAARVSPWAAGGIAFAGIAALVGGLFAGATWMNAEGPPTPSVELSSAAPAVSAEVRAERDGASERAGAAEQVEAKDEPGVVPVTDPSAAPGASPRVGGAARAAAVRPSSAGLPHQTDSGKQPSGASVSPTRQSPEDAAPNRDASSEPRNPIRL